MSAGRASMLSRLYLDAIIHAFIQVELHRAVNQLDGYGNPTADATYEQVRQVLAIGVDVRDMISLLSCRPMSSRSWEVCQHVVMLAFE